MAKKSTYNSQPSHHDKVYERHHMAVIIALENKIQELFNRFALQVGKPLSKIKYDGRGVWTRNRNIELAVERMLRQFGSEYKALIRQLMIEAWERAQEKNDKTVMDLIKKVGIVIGGKLLLDLFNRKQGKLDLDEVTISSILALPRRQEALAAFLRKNKLRLSPRIWLLTRETKILITKYLAEGLAQGRSAQQISRDVRTYLREPNKKFRRIRDPETGKLKLSKPAAAYHPGRGVYRSSYKNALRMARTEVNAAYRSADMHRWKNSDQVLGYEVHLSGSHVVTDICDEMTGRYPKNFHFEGWHPACFCYATPLLPTQDQFVRYLETGSIGKQNYKTRIPGKAWSYIEEKKDKILAMKTKPFWIQDNFKIKGNELIPKHNF